MRRDAQDNLLHGGRFAASLLEDGGQADGIPGQSIQQGPQGSFVWVIGPDESVTTRPVTVAYISGSDALINSGLQANEKVVVDGQYRLQAGVHVKELVGAAAQGANLQSSVEQEIP